MRTAQSFFKADRRAVLFSVFACACSASGNAVTMSTGGSHPGVGGNATGAMTGNNTVGGDSAAGGGGNPAGGGGNPAGGAATGGVPAATGGSPTGGAPCVPGTQVGATFSTNFFVMAFPQLSPFYVFNNGWSTSTTNLTSPGTQESISTYETCTPGTISWATSYNWSGANNTVKAYPAAILGWQSTKGFQVSSSLTGLPKTISSLSSVKCSWAYTVSGGASQNISFDIWVHNTACTTTAIGTSTAASDEVMIWLYSSGGVQPIGGNGSPVTVAGQSWNLATGSNGSGAVHSFVHQGNLNSVTNLDILAFLNYLNMGSKCLSSIEAGTEVFTGSGTLKTDSYSCTVQ